jgi:Uma2 family endonuclease
VYRASDLRDVGDHRSEIVDGALYQLPDQTRGHARACNKVREVLDYWTEGRRNPKLEVVAGMAVTIDEWTRLRPDVMVVRWDDVFAVRNVPVEDVVLVVEVADESTRERDHEQKPQLYASAGIRHYWVVGLEPDDCPYLDEYSLLPGRQPERTRHYGLADVTMSFEVRLYVPALYERGDHGY